jgi:hypothetical protein
MTVTSPAPWPLQTRLELAAHPNVPGVVRGQVRAMAGEWGLAGLAETAELLVSELASNAGGVGHDHSGRSMSPGPRCDAPALSGSVRPRSPMVEAAALKAVPECPLARALACAFESHRGHVPVAPGPWAEAQNHSVGQWVVAGAVGPQVWLHSQERIQRGIWRQRGSISSGGATRHCRRAGNWHRLRRDLLGSRQRGRQHAGVAELGEPKMKAVAGYKRGAWLIEAYLLGHGH